MKELKEKLLNVNGVLFNIISPYTEEINTYFEEFIVSTDKSEFARYNIYFDVDKDKFNKYLKYLSDKDLVVYDTFLNQKHYGYNNIFLIDSKDYVCEKIDEFNYKVIANGSKPYKSLIRIIRELLIREMEDNKYFYMHGTGININDKGILLLGGSGSGKTTLTTKINDIDIPQKFISNDRVFLNGDEITYYPLPIVYAMGTVKNNSKLDNYFRCGNVLENRRGKNYDTANNDTKCDIPLTDISKIFFNVKNVSWSNVDIIIFPKISDKCLVKEINHDDAINRLCFNNFTPNDAENERKEWLKFRKISLSDVEYNKMLMNEYLIKNKTILEFEYSLTAKSEEIYKKLIKKIC